MSIEEFFKLGSEEKYFTFKGLVLKVKDVALSPGVTVRNRDFYYCEGAISITFEVLNFSNTTIVVDESTLKEFEDHWLSELAVFE